MSAALAHPVAPAAPTPPRGAFDSLPVPLRAVLEDYLERVTYPRGALIVQQGEPGNSVVGVDSGSARLELAHPDLRSEAVLDYAEPGSLIGEVAFLDGGPRPTHAIAHTDVEASILTREAFERLAEERPDVALHVSRLMGAQSAKRVREANDRHRPEIFKDVIDHDVNAMVKRGQAAADALQSWSEAQVDNLLDLVCARLMTQAKLLAELAVRETGMGNVSDKIHKNLMACLDVMDDLRGQRASGEISRDETKGIVEYASPVGVVFALVPITSPVGALIFKALICIKSRNAVILSGHRGAAKTGKLTATFIRSALEAGGANPDLVQTVEGRASRMRTSQFLHHPDIGMILATGGPDMVKAAYSAGKPALGVGAGNTPVWVCSDADARRTAHHIVRGKRYDNGIICGSEHNIVVDAAIRERFIEGLEAEGAAVLTPEERARLVSRLVDPQQHWRREVLGAEADALAKRADIRRPWKIKLLVAPAELNEVEGLWGSEKMALILSLFTVNGTDQGLDTCARILAWHGAGHTAAIHTFDEENIRRFCERMPAARLLVRTPASYGMFGATTDLPLSFTLGCGTFGGNSTTDGVHFRHLLNIKRMALGNQKEV